MKQIIIVRHGESLEDINNDIYAEISDNQIPLTANGILQVKNCSDEVKRKLKFKKIHLFHGESVRVTQSAKILYQNLLDEYDVEVKQSSLLNKQDWGTVTYLDRKKAEAERYKVGVLDYRYSNGECGRDVERRTAVFLKGEVFVPTEGAETTSIVVSHGFNYRFILKILLQLSDSIFIKLANPPQCYVSSLFASNSRYHLEGELLMYDSKKNPSHVNMG